MFSMLVKGIWAQRPGQGIWLSLQMPVAIGKKWQWHQDMGYRTVGLSIRPAQYLYRTGLRYRLGQETSVAAGIAGFFTRSLLLADQGEFGKEFRFWQEVNWVREKQQQRQWQVRGRIEQRFFSATKTKSEAYANRFRLRVALTEQIKGPWNVQIADEWMQQQKSGTCSFDQNRVILNIIKKGKSQSQWAAGYMWLKWPRESQHIITVAYQQTIRLHGN